MRDDFLRIVHKRCKGDSAGCEVQNLLHEMPPTKYGAESFLSCKIVIESDGVPSESSKSCAVIKEARVNNVMTVR